jgi:hypothetical protein
MISPFKFLSYMDFLSNIIGEQMAKSHEENSLIVTCILSASEWVDALQKYSHSASEDGRKFRLVFSLSQEQNAMAS